MLSPSKIALFIDGANLYATAKTLGFEVDCKRLLSEFGARGTILRAFYYTAIVEDQALSSIRPLIDWLEYNGYTVVTKPMKEFIEAGGRREVKGNMNIELAVDAMELAGHIDQMVLFSGDGDFRSLVAAMQRRGVRVTVVSTIASRPPMITDELRRQADVFTDLTELQGKIAVRPNACRCPSASRVIARSRSQSVSPSRDLRETLACSRSESRAKLLVRALTRLAPHLVVRSSSIHHELQNKPRICAELVAGKGAGSQQWTSQRRDLVVGRSGFGHLGRCARALRVIPFAAQTLRGCNVRSARKEDAASSVRNRCETKFES